MKAEYAINKLRAKRVKIAVAESCTGGLLCGALTSIPGSSECFDFGVVTYSNEAKYQLLGVPREVLETYGAVSYQTAYWMAVGVRKAAKAHIGLSVTGIAGPSGGSEKKPVGLVYIALAEEKFSVTHKFSFKGNREEVRNMSVKSAIELLIDYELVF